MSTKTILIIVLIVFIGIPLCLFAFSAIFLRNAQATQKKDVDQFINNINAQTQI